MIFFKQNKGPYLTYKPNASQSTNQQHFNLPTNKSTILQIHYVCIFTIHTDQQFREAWLYKHDVGTV